MKTWLFTLAVIFAVVSPSCGGMVIGSGGVYNAPPVVTSFTVGTPSGLTVPITAFTATDDAAVLGYLITETAAQPTLATSGWTGTAPTSYTTGASGTKSLYPWAKDSIQVSALFGTPPSVTFVAKLVYSDNFDRVNGVVGSNWTTITGMNTPQITSNSVSGTGAGAYWSAYADGDNQFSQATLGFGTAWDYGDGPAVRISSTAKTFYTASALDVDNGDGGVDSYYQLRKCVNGACSVLATGNRVGFDLKLEATGNATSTTLTVRDGAITRITYTDTNSPITGGKPGFAQGSTAGTSLLSWTGGAL